MHLLRHYSDATELRQSPPNLLPEKLELRSESPLKIGLTKDDRSVVGEQFAFFLPISKTLLRYHDKERNTNLVTTTERL